MRLLSPLYTPALTSINGRGARFYLVAGLVKWGGARMETAPRRYVDRLGCATAALFAAGLLIYQG